MCVFVQNPKKAKMETFAFCVITLETIKIQTRQASQHDRLNLNYVKDEHRYDKKCPEMVVKWSFMSNFYFETVFMQFLCRFFWQIYNMYITKCIFCDCHKGNLMLKLFRSSNYNYENLHEMLCIFMKFGPLMINTHYLFFNSRQMKEIFHFFLNQLLDPSKKSYTTFKPL